MAKPKPKAAPRRAAKPKAKPKPRPGSKPKPKPRIPVAETPPFGLTAYWLGVWRHALKVMKEQDSWAWEQKPLLDEYVAALVEAEGARQLAKEDPYHETEKGLLHPHPGFAQADRASRRAVVLAGTLLITPEAQRAHGLDEPGEEEPKGDQAGL